MVERRNNLIIYNPGERLTFDVPAEDTIPRALHMAGVFLETGVQLARQAGVTLDANDEYFTPAVRQKCPRALELIRFSNAVAELCGPELIEQMFREDES